jgi:protein-L-isoaspartate(D-aspartate) O-methyltransferase
MRVLLELCRCGIMDSNVVRAMDEVPREQFVMQNQVKSAYSDRAMPIACGQSISQPYIVAYMTEQLEVEPQHHVLEVGTGSGYQAAVLSRLVKKVTSIERYRTLARTARARRLLTTMWRSSSATVLPVFPTGPVRSHHRHRRSGNSEACSTARDRRMMILPLGPHGGHQSLVRPTRTEGGFARNDLIGVRFVPLLPGQGAGAFSRVACSLRNAGRRRRIAALHQGNRQQKRLFRKDQAENQIVPTTSR